MRGLKLAAFIFMIISICSIGLTLLPLCWMIPMCVYYYRNDGYVSTGFKVCTLLFCSFIGGILMLCDD